MDNDGTDYKKAFELLMCTMIMKTLAPSTEPFGGSPDLCIECMQQRRHLIHGDDGEKKLICDRFPYNITAYKGED